MREFDEDYYEYCYWRDILKKNPPPPVEHRDPKLFNLDDDFVLKAKNRFRALTKKQYEDEELRLLQQRVRWTDILRQGTGSGANRGQWFARINLEETENAITKVRQRIRYLSMPVKELSVIDIGAVKQVPIGNLFPVNAAGFFINNPLRVESSPSNSLHWDKNKNKWTDYGSGEHGDNIDLVMKVEKCTFKEACKIILQGS